MYIPEDTYHVFGLKDGNWHIYYTSGSRRLCEKRADRLELESGIVMAMVVKVL